MIQQEKRSYERFKKKGLTTQAKRAKMRTKQLENQLDEELKNAEENEKLHNELRTRKPDPVDAGISDNDLRSADPAPVNDELQPESGDSTGEVSTENVRSGDQPIRD